MEILFGITFIVLLFVLRGFTRVLAILAGITGISLIFTGPSPVTLIAGGLFIFFLGGNICFRMMQ
jgi:hypothetical protein